MRLPKLNKTSMSLGLGEEFQLTANVTALSDETVKWYSSSGKIVTVKNGKIKGMSVGTAVVTALAKDGTKATCTITVKKAPKTVTLTKGVLTLGVGEKCSLGSGVDSDSASAKRTYRTSNSSIIKMNRTDWIGEFTAQKPGVAYVTVRTYNGKECTCKVIVKNAPKTVSLTKGTLTMFVGENFKLGSGVDNGAAAAKRTYRSSNSNIIKMTRTDWAGEFTAINTGVAYVTVRLYNGLEKACKVIVKRRVTELCFEQNIAVLNVGETFGIRAIQAVNQDIPSLTYSVNNSNIASVDSNGVIKAKKVGTTDIKVTTQNNVSSNFTVIVSGIKDKVTFPKLSTTNQILNSAKLYPMKTNYEPVDKLVDKIFANIIKSGMTQEQKARACYDYVTKNCVYGVEDSPDMSSYFYSHMEDHETVRLSYSMLKNNTGTQDNCSAAFAILMRRLGFEANIAKGKAMFSEGNYGNHTWVDVTVNGKHYIFDPQIENRNIGKNNSVYYYFYGMEAENNYKMYRYDSISHIHDFSCIHGEGIMDFTSRITVSCGNQKIQCSKKIPDGENYNYVYISDSYSDVQKAMLKQQQKKLQQVNFEIEMLKGPVPYYVELYVEHCIGDKVTPICKKVVINKTYDNYCNFSWTPNYGKGEYNVKVAIYYATDKSPFFADNMINAFDYCTKYNFYMSVD